MAAKLLFKHWIMFKACSGAGAGRPGGDASTRGQMLFPDQCSPPKGNLASLRGYITVPGTRVIFMGDFVSKRKHFPEVAEHGESCWWLSHRAVLSRGV